MQVKLEFITPDAENFIGRMAGVCYGRETDREKNIKRAAKCAEDGHLATLRFAHSVFNISGISRVCSHQMVRSKHLDFLQRSQRYCKELDADFVIPDSIMKDRDLEVEYKTHLRKSRELYTYLQNNGIRKEDARFVLPEATHTELNVSGNLQAWRDFIRLRADKYAQWEVRTVAIMINNILAKECPNLFKLMETF